MVGEPLLSVIIPTRDRADLLMRVVDSLLDQEVDLDGQLEIVVVDDGSEVDIATRLLALAAEREQGNRVRYLRQPPRGPSAARNTGVRAARSSIVLFMGDDIVPLPGFLQSHVQAHTVEYPEECVAVLGLADLAPEFCKTPFANWWRTWNFRYTMLLKNKRKPDFSFFYTNNLSLKRAFLLRHGLFDESFAHAAYEDGELGFRLTHHGLRVVFKPEAKAMHHHEMNLESACHRMITRGASYDLFVEKTGASGLSKLWMWLGSGFWMRPSIIRPLRRLSEWGQTRANLGFVYILVLMYYFQVGRGLRPPLD